LNAFTALLLGRGFRDDTSEFVAIRREVLDGIRLQGDYGEYFIDLVVRARQRGYRLVEVPFANRPRRCGTSKTATNLGQYLRRGHKYMATVMRLRCSV